MNKSFEKKLTELFKAEKKLELLQYAYAIIFVLVTLIAGLIALVKQSVGVSFLIIPLICLISFSMNLVTWSIVKTAIEHFYPEISKKEEKKDEKESKSKAKKSKK